MRYTKQAGLSKVSFSKNIGERDRTIFAKQVLLLLLLVSFFHSCRKNSEVVAGSVDLGVYASTEAGDSVLSVPQDSLRVTGYTDKRSYYPGDSVKLYFSGPEGNRQLQLYDINGNKVFTIDAFVRRQKISVQKPWVNGYGYTLTANFTLPNNIKSGVYRWMNTITFIVKSRTTQDVTVVFPTNTINAYCPSGGKSLYAPAGARAFVVSFLRDQYVNSRSYALGFLQWMATQSYNVNYIADEDLDDLGNFENSKLLIIVGHSEYWTRKARENFDKFVERGKNGLVLAGNTMWWQVRYNKEKDAMICYKGSSEDPLANSPYDTRLWNTPFLQYPIISSIGNDYQYGGYGKEHGSKISDSYKIVEPNSPLFAGTNLKNGDSLEFLQNECDGSLLINKPSQGPNDVPIVDKQALNFFKVELLAYFQTFNYDYSNYNPGTATFIVFKKAASSGTIVNCGSETWGDRGFLGPGKKFVQIITKNMIDRSLDNSTLFSD